MEKAGRDLKVIAEADTGIADAWNKALKIASSPWVTFLNSGDFLVVLRSAQPLHQ